MCGDPGWGRRPPGCSLTIGGDYEARWNQFDMGCKSSDLAADYQLVCSGPQLDTAAVKSFDESLAQYSDYCIAVRQTDYCTKSSTEEACYTYRKCIAGVGQWFPHSNERCVDTVSPCFWDPENNSCHRGLGYYGERVILKSGQPNIAHWNYADWLAEHQRFLLDSVAPGYEGDPVPTYSYTELAGFKNRADGRSREVTSMNDRDSHTHFGKDCIGRRRTLLEEDGEDDDEEEAHEDQMSLMEGNNALHMYDRRHLLGGLPKIPDPLAPVNKMIMMMMDPIIEGINDAAGFVEDTANDAWNGVQDTWKDVEGIANDLKDIPAMVWDKIMSVVPTDFDPAMGSIDSVLNEFLSESVAEKAGCGGPEFCAFTGSSDDPSHEPTVCDSEADCDNSKSDCWTPDQDMCPAFDNSEPGGGANEHAAWAKSCKCLTLRAPVNRPTASKEERSHCNFASGFCEAGVSPFTTPIKECAATPEFSLVYGAAGYNALCYLSHLWTCTGKAAEVDVCRTKLGHVLQGPSLCRAFCAPTFENRNNRLTQYQLLDNNRECVCEIGVDPAYPNAADTQTSAAGTVHMIAIDSPSRRKLLEAIAEKK